MRWPVETSRAQPAAFDCYRGETLSLEARLTSYGTALELPTNAACRIYWQTNGMEDAWWSAPAAASGSVMRASFTPDMDCGAKSYACFLGISGSVYRAAFALRMRHAPGAVPNLLTSPTRILDLEATTVVNPPWPTTNDFATATNLMEAALKTYVDGQICVAGAVTPGTVTNIVTNVVTKSYVESLGIESGLDTNAVRGIASSASVTNLGALVAATNAAASDAAAKFMPLDGSKRMTGNIRFELDGDLSGEIGFNTQDEHFAIAVEDEDIVEFHGANEISLLNIDGSDVLTQNAADARYAPTSTASSVSALATQVASIAANLNAEDARFVSTNYNSATKLPEAYVEVQLTDDATSSKYWYRIWSEMTRWNAFLGTNFTFTGWVGFHAWSTNVAARIDACAPREYAFYDGVTGDVAPDGIFQVSQPRILICAGAGYQRYVDGAHEVWLLESNGMVADVNGTTNGFFRITDSDGDVQFEIVKGDKQTVFANANSLTRQTVSGVTHFFTTYAVTNAAAAPTAKFATSLTNATWYADSDASCPCNVSWTAGVNSYTLEWWPKGDYSQMFVKADYQRGGETYIRNAAPVSMQKIVIDNVTYTLGTASISGNTVLTLTPAQ